MNLLRTDRTYKTRDNAVKALAKKIDLELVDYVIAVNEEGRFAPVVIRARNSETTNVMGLVHEGITVTGA